MRHPTVLRPIADCRTALRAVRPTLSYPHILIHLKSDANIAFRDLCTILKPLGFEERVRGNHFIYTRSDVEEILNIQPIGAKAKAYQVKQVRNIIFKYKLGEIDAS